MTDPYLKAAMSGAQARDLHDRVLACAERMTDDQILTLADALHAFLRARKRGKPTGAYLEIRV